MCGCNTLQNAATHCSILQHPAAHCNATQRTAKHCNTQTYRSFHARAHRVRFQAISGTIVLHIHHRCLFLEETKHEEQKIKQAFASDMTPQLPRAAARRRPRRYCSKKKSLHSIKNYHLRLDTRLFIIRTYQLCWLQIPPKLFILMKS